MDILPPDDEQTRFRQRGRELAREWSRQLGMPADADWRRIWSHWPLSTANPVSRLLVWANHDADSMVLAFDSHLLRSWDGYVLDLFGLVVGHDEPGDWPRWWVTLDTEEIPIQIWRFWAHVSDAHAGAELRWSPAEGVSKRLVLFEGWEALKPAEQDKAVLSAAGGMRAIQGFMRHAGGRPKGSRKGRVWRRRDYLEWYREAREAYARDGERLTLRHLGAAMGVSEDTASTRLRDPEVDLPWPPEAHPKVWEPDP